MSININNLNSSTPQVKQKLEQQQIATKQQANQAALKSDQVKHSGQDSVSLTPQAKQLRELQKKANDAPEIDQKKIAGVGNIYADESCFSAGIRPNRRGDSLSDEERARLCLAIKTVLKEGLKYRGSSVSDYTDASGNNGSFQDYHKVYRKTGEECVNCKHVIEKIKLSGRSTHFCPSCQSEGE